MPNESSSYFLDICNKVIKYSVYTLLFLMPLFFLPWTQDQLEFNKQAILVAGSFIALFAWVIKILIEGKLTLRLNKIHLGLGILLVIYLVSSIFSVSRYGSFWGWPQVSSASLLSFICFSIVYFIVANIFTEKEILTSFSLLLLSSFFAVLYGVLQIMGWHILPFNFTKDARFNTIGSIGTLGLYAAVMLFLSLILAVTTKTWQRIFYLACTILSFATLFIINYRFIWIATVVGAIIMVVFWVIRRDIFESRWMFLPVFFFFVSLFFVMFNPQIGWLPAKPLEVYLSTHTTLGIDASTLKHFPFVGSGPGTFLYDFSKFKSSSYNEGILWNVTFQQGSSKFLTDLATLGALGIVVLVAIIIYALFWAVRYLTLEHSQSHERMSLVLLVFGVLAIQTVANLLNNSTMVQDFVFFFALGALVALITKNQKEYILQPSSLPSLISTLVFTAIFIFEGGVLMIEAQRYYAAVHYNQAIESFRQGDRAGAITLLKQSAGSDSKLDLYFNQLSLFSFSKLQEEATNAQNATDKNAEKTKIEGLISDSVSAANTAISLNDKNLENWSTKGYVCQNLLGLLSDAQDCSIASYDKAIELSPTNPYLYLQEANVYVASASLLTNDQNSLKLEALGKAREKFNKAIELKKDYALAYFQKALMERALGNTVDFEDALRNAEGYGASDSTMLLQVGLVYYGDKNWNMAQVEFQKALALSPQYADALYFAGLTFDQQNNDKEALNTFNRLLELDPSNAAIKKIIDNLKTKRPILEGLTQQTPPPPQKAPEPTTEPSPKPAQ